MTYLRLPQTALASLREQAAARGQGAAAACQPRPVQHRRGSCTCAGAVASMAEVLMPVTTAAHNQQQYGRHASRSAAPGGGGVQSTQSSLLRSTIKQLLEAGRPVVAAHVLREEWLITGRGLEDEALSKELIRQLLAEVNTSAAVEALPMVAASPAMLTDAITAAAARRSARGVRALLAHAVETGVAQGRESRDLWCAAIVAYGGLDRIAEARRAFQGMRDSGAWQLTDTRAANLLLNALACDVGLQFVRCNQLRQEGMVPDVSTFNCLLKACMRARDVRRASLALTWMQEDRVQPDEITWNTLLKVHAYASDFHGVLSVWRAMAGAGITPTAKLWGSLLLACSAAGQMEQAAIYWWEMKQLQLAHKQQAGDARQGGGRGARAQQHSGGRKGKWGSGGVITTDNMCAMMTACNDAGQYERALTVLEEGKALGVPLDTRAYNIALRACHTPGKTLRQEQLLQAFALYDELKRSGLSPDSFTFGTLFSLCAAAHQGHVALQLYAEMGELGVQENVVVVTLLLKAVGSSPGPGMADECLRIFRRMAHGPARVKPNQTTYRTVIGALREGGALAEALGVYQSMRQRYPADNSEFEGLIALAAERALSSEDALLREAVAQVCAITDTRQVDLHGMSVLEARAAVLCVLAMLQHGFRDTGAVPHDVTLITGRGRGSEGGHAVLRQEVYALLRELHLELPQPEEEAEAQAAPTAGGAAAKKRRGGRASAANPGRVVIPRQLIHQALHRKMLNRQAHQGQAVATADGSDGSAAGAPPS